MMISVTILVKNGACHLEKVLTSCKDFDEVLLLDTGSTDDTLQIARKFPNVSIHQEKFTGFGPAHNHAASLAKNSWILSLDADEVLSPELAQEIASLALDPHCVYALPFHNYFNDKKIKWCGWHPESHVRLYHRDRTCFSDALVHEAVLTLDLKKVSLHHPVNHFSYNSISDFLTKMENYSTLFSLEYKEKKKSSPWIALYHGVGAFLKSFFLKKGILGGYEGFLISAYNGHTAFYKYLKLYHVQADNTDVPSRRSRETR